MRICAVWHRDQRKVEKMAEKKKSTSIYRAYGYGTVDGVEQYGCFHLSKDDSKESKFVGYGRYIAVERVSKDIDGGSPVLTIGFDTLDGERDSINLQRELLSKKKDVQAVLLKSDADVYDSSLNVLMNCLHVSEETAVRGKCFHRTGWIVEHEGTDRECMFFKGSRLSWEAVHLPFLFANCRSTREAQKQR